MADMSVQELRARIRRLKRLKWRMQKAKHKPTREDFSTCLNEYGKRVRIYGTLTNDGTNGTPMIKNPKFVTVSLKKGVM